MPSRFAAEGEAAEHMTETTVSDPNRAQQEAFDDDSALWSRIPLPFPSNKAHLGWEMEGAPLGVRDPALWALDFGLWGAAFLRSDVFGPV